MSTVPFRQGTDAWLAERRTGIGSSDAPIIAGVAPWGDLRALWAEKAGLAVAPPIETDRMRWGRLLEQAVAEAYTETTGRQLQRVNLIRRHRRYPYMIASLDRKTRVGKRLVEIKTAGFAHDGWGDPGTGDVPDYYQVQVQHQLAVTGYDVADVPVLFGGSDFRVYTVERDEGVIAALIEMEAAFWRHVTTKTPPPDPNRLRVVRPLREGERVADESLADLIRRGKAARDALAAAKATSEHLDEQVKAAIDDWTSVRGLATYKPNRDSQVTDWRLVASAYRKALTDGMPEGFDPDAIESLFTNTKEGARPLRYLNEGASDD